MFPGRINWHAGIPLVSRTLWLGWKRSVVSVLSASGTSALDEFGISSWQSNCLYQSDWSRVSLLIRSGWSRQEKTRGR